MKRLIVVFFLFFSTQLAAENAFDRVYVFGDSLSDTGNLASVVGAFPNPPFFNNRVSNGPVSVETVAAGLNLELAASLHLIGPAVGTDYAVASARAVGTTALDLPAQINIFLANHGGVAPAEALYIVFIGGNDVRDARDSGDSTIANNIISAAVASEIEQIAVLAASGARNILVMNVPDIGRIPETRLLQALTGDTKLVKRTQRLTKKYNKRLKKQLKRLEKQSEIDIEIFNTFKAFARIINDAEENGFTNTTEACFSSVSLSFNPGCNFGANFSSYIFFDEIHPTGRVHAMIGEAVLKQLDVNEQEDD